MGKKVLYVYDELTSRMLIFSNSWESVLRLLFDGQTLTYDLPA